jgi:hypothetical protein
VFNRKLNLNLVPNLAKPRDVVRNLKTQPNHFMKKFYSLFVLFLFALYSCEGSDSYQGKWKALDSNGAKFEITFSLTNFSIKDSIGKSNNYQYTQNSIKSENSIETYGILLKDGRGYQIYFPKKDESVGLILDENGKQMFTISRKNYVTYEEIYKLN